MIVRKKDWLALTDQVSKLEQDHETVVKVINKNAGQMADNYAEAKKVNSDMKSLVDNVLCLRATVYGLLSKIKNCFDTQEIFTPSEIEKMSSVEYARKVLKPLGIQMSSTVKYL